MFIAAAYLYVFGAQGRHQFVDGVLERGAFQIAGRQVQQAEPLGLEHVSNRLCQSQDGAGDDPAQQKDQDQEHAERGGQDDERDVEQPELRRSLQGAAVDVADSADYFGCHALGGTEAYRGVAEKIRRFARKR